MINRLLKTGSDSMRLPRWPRRISERKAFLIVGDVLLINGAAAACSWQGLRVSGQTEATKGETLDWLSMRGRVAYVAVAGEVLWSQQQAWSRIMVF